MDNTLLNWDGTFSVNDMLENIKHTVHRFTGWKYLRVSFSDGVLRIATRNEEGWEAQLLAYDVRGFGREVYGRLAHVGLAAYARELKLLA